MESISFLDRMGPVGLDPGPSLWAADRPQQKKILEKVIYPILTKLVYHTFLRESKFGIDNQAREVHKRSLTKILMEALCNHTTCTIYTIYPICIIYTIYTIDTI
jgi:hypothetical protein